MNTVKGSITLLIDNTVPERSEAIAEHGFAALVQTQAGNLLFDTGRGAAVVHNAGVLKKDLASINKIVLSHSHHDHTGGLPKVLQILPGKKTDVLAHPDVFAERFRKKNGEEIYGGIPFRKGYLEKMGSRFVFNKEVTEVEEGVFLTGEVPRKTSFEGGDMKDRFIIREGNVEPDLILDDQSLILHTSKGILLLLGCAHAGIINVINHAMSMTGQDDILAVIGGTHIGLSGDAQREQTIEALQNYKIQHVIPSHCTGLEAMARMRNALGDRFQFSHVGLTFRF